MELNVQDWKEFNVTRLFDICAGNYYSSEDYEYGTTPYVSASATNNGVGQMIDLPPDFSENKIVTGKVECKAFYQGKPFSATSDANIFVPKFEMTQNVGLFLTSIITFNENGKWSYGRQCRVGDSKEIIVKLPIKHNEDSTPVIDENRTYSDEGYIPDWQFMEDYIKSLHHKPITTKVNNSNIPQLNIHSWEWFSLEKLFDIKKGKRLTLADQEEGNNNYVGAIDSNNGIANHIGQAPIHEANTISLSYNGSVGEAFYQSEPYWATDDVNALYSRYSGFNTQIGLFMATVIRQEKYKFSYGRKWTLENMNSTDIKLPIKMDNNGNPVIDDKRKYSDNGYIPDWQFMEDYINSLPYSDRI